MNNNPSAFGLFNPGWNRWLGTGPLLDSTVLDAFTEATLEGIVPSIGLSGVPLQIRRWDNPEKALKHSIETGWYGFGFEVKEISPTELED